MTIAQIRENLTQLGDIELLKTLDSYRESPSRGVNDEVMISLIEEELFIREKAVM